MKLTYENESVTIAVEWDRWDGDHAQWKWEIGCAGETLATGDDLRSGVGDPSITGALSSLVSFLEAWDESWNYSGVDGENADLFPASLRELSVDWQSFGDAFTVEANA